RWVREPPCRSMSLFFFQAEDGIRDFHVTGVQTCALPIFDGSGNIGMGYSKSSAALNPKIMMTGRTPSDPAGEMRGEVSCTTGTRSEERRVGKECRYMAAKYNYKVNTAGEQKAMETRRQT